MFARSACPHCGTRLSGWDLVPLASYVFLRGRCRHCGQPIGLLHLAGGTRRHRGGGLGGTGRARSGWVWIDCALGWTLLTLAWIDWTSLLLPDVLTLPLLLAGLTLTLTLRPDDLADHCLAAALGYLSFQGLALLYRRLRGRDGLGGGDAKLIAAAGAWCGLEALPLVVLGSAVAGLLTALGLALVGRTDDIQNTDTVRSLRRAGILGGVAAWRPGGGIRPDVRGPRMRRAIAAIALIVTAQPVLALDRGPVCREPTVVDEMTREIRTQQYYSQVDPALVTEQPTATSNVVRCQVCVQVGAVQHDPVRRTADPTMHRARVRSPDRAVRVRGARSAVIREWAGGIRAASR